MIYRIVVDTNLIISAFLWDGPPGKLINEIVAREMLLLTSLPMMTELETTLQKPKFASRFQMQGRTVETVMDEYRRITKIVAPAELPDNIVRDPKDHMILAAAVGGGASHLISGDQDLTTLVRYQQVMIVTATQFLLSLNPPTQQVEDVSS